MCRFLSRYKFSTHLDQYQESLIVGSHGKSTFSFVGSRETVSQNGCLSHASTSECAAASPPFGILGVLDFGLSVGWVVLSLMRCLDLLSTFWLGSSFSYHWVFSYVYLGYKFFISYVFYKYFLPGWSFHFLNNLCVCVCLFLFLFFFFSFCFILKYSWFAVLYYNTVLYCSAPLKTKLARRTLTDCTAH